MWCDNRQHKSVVITAVVLTAVVCSGTGTRAQQVSTFERTLRLAEGGSFQLTNISGDITVVGIPGRYVRIAASKRAHSTDAEALLEATAVEIEAGEGRITVRTRHPASVLERRTESQEQTQVSVTYTVEVPRDVSVVLRTTSGNIHVSGIEMDVDLESVSGSIKADGTGGSISAGSVRGSITINGAGAGADANTVSGDIVLAGVKRRLRATCVSGDITIRGGELMEVWANNTGGDIHCEGTVAMRARYQLTSHSGDIEFVADGGEGFQVSLSTVSGSISAPLELTLTGSRTSRRSLTGVYLHPDASVELTAFSGNITLLTVPQRGLDHQSRRK